MVTLPKDAERFADNLYSSYGSEIKDQESYLKAVEDYMEENPIPKEWKTGMLPKAYARIKRRYEKELPEYKISEEDLAEEIQKAEPDKVIGTVKNKVVRGTKTSFKLYSKTVTRYRDVKGRFISVKKTESEE